MAVIVMTKVAYDNFKNNFSLCDKMQHVIFLSPDITSTTMMKMNGMKPISKRLRMQPFLIVLVVLSIESKVWALQNLFTTPQWSVWGGRTSSAAAIQLEDQLLEAIANANNRLSNDDTVESLIQALENTASISEPAVAPAVYGRWRLLYTTAAETSSPIQRRAVNAQQFPIYQDIVVRTDDQRLLVKQIVEFSPQIRLSVDALASTAAYPLEEFRERQSAGTILGWNLLGVSLVGEKAQPNPDRPNSRIDFVFDEGNFRFGDSFQIPYPVPFRSPLFWDWVKGWIDITYLSDRLRISRGNKGTTFVLLKESGSDE
jgi:PAP_fibrillin